MPTIRAARFERRKPPRFRDGFLCNVLQIEAAVRLERWRNICGDENQAVIRPQFGDGFPGAAIPLKLVKRPLALDANEAWKSTV